MANSFVMLPQLVLLLLFIPSEGHESCCNSAILNSISRNQQSEQLPTAVVQIMADQYPNIPLEIPDPEATMPAGWDEEEDGQWEPRLISNPEYVAKGIELAKQHARPVSHQIVANILDSGKLIEVVSNAATSLYGACPWLVLGLFCAVAMQAVMAMLPSLTDLVNLQPPPSVSTSSVNVGSVRTSLYLSVKGAALGIVTPLCNCGTLPMALSMAQSGATSDAVVSFVTAAQSAGLDSLAFTYGLLGPKVALARLVGAAALAITVGFASCCGTVSSSKNKHRTNGQPESDGCCGRPQPMEQTKLENDAKVGGVLVALYRMQDLFEEIGPSIFAGLVLTSATAILLPMHLLWGSDTGTLVGRFVIIGAALPLQMCEHSVVTFAAALQKSGASPGTAFAFLLSAPACNTATLSLVRTCGGGPRATLQCAVAVVVAAVSLSYLADAAGANVDMVGDASESLPEWCMQGSSGLVLVLTLIYCLRILGLAVSPTSLSAHRTADQVCKAELETHGMDCCVKHKEQ